MEEFLNFPYRPEACKFIKNETLAQVFSCEFYEISKNIFFTEHHLATASEKQPAEVFYEKKLFLKVPQNSQENTYVGVSF